MANRFTYDRTGRQGRNARGPVSPAYFAAGSPQTVQARSNSWLQNYAPGGCISPSYQPAGSLVTGAPPTSMEPGSYNFRTNFAVQDHRPNSPTANVAARIQAAMNELTPGLRLSNLQVGVAPSQDRRNAFWVTMTGRIDASQGHLTTALNRALARGFWQGSTFSSVPGIQARPLPADGAQLNTTLNAPNACTGGTNNSVIPQGCTSFERVTGAATQTGQLPATDAAIGRAADQISASLDRLQQTGTAPSPTPTPGTPQAPGVACTIASPEMFYLRPTATFARQGPSYPRGTQVSLLGGGPVSQQGSNFLWRVRVGGTEGYAVFAATSTRGCTGAPAVTSGGGASSSPPASAPPRQELQPVRSQTPSTQASLSGSGSQSNTLRNIGYGVAAFVGVTALAGGAMYYMDKSERKAAKKAAKKARKAAR